MSRTVLVLLTVVLSACTPGVEKMNLLFVTFDTTRADALSVYGNDQIELPGLQRLAAEGVVFERAYASVPITLPSHATMMTGRHPFNHGARDNGVFVLDGDQLTLAEVLRESGWKTAAAVGSFPLNRQFGINQGFDFFDDEVEGSESTVPGAEGLFFDERPAGRVNASILDWLQANAGDPFFLWVHYFDPHHPLIPPAPYKGMYADPYLAEIAYADENLDFLLTELDRLGVAPRTVVLVASDHGEGRGQHSEDTHSLLVYDATLHVPLILKIPGGPAGRRVATPVGLVDLFPTVLELFGVEAPEGIDGRSLASVFTAGAPDPAPRALYAETMSPRINYGWGELRSLRNNGMKYIHGPRSELFDVEGDPEELSNLITDRPEVGAKMRESLSTFLDVEVDSTPSVQQRVDEETLAKLEALGYLQGGGDDSDIEERLNDDGVPPQDRVHLVSKHSMVKNQLLRQQYRQARILAMELVEESPENPLYLRLLATAELHLGLDDQAVEHLVTLVGPEHSETNRSMAMGAMAAARINPALAMRMIGAIERSEAQKPTAVGQHLTARCLWMLGRFNEGEQAIRRALVIDPNHLLSKIDLGTYLVRDQRVEEGRALLEEAVRDDPFSLRSWQALGTARWRSGDPQSAGLAFERALDLQPNNSEVMHELIEVYMATNRESEARDLLETMRRLTEEPQLELTRRVEDRWPED